MDCGEVYEWADPETVVPPDRLLTNVMVYWADWHRGLLRPALRRVVLARRTEKRRPDPHRRGGVRRRRRRSGTTAGRVRPPHRALERIRSRPALRGPRATRALHHRPPRLLPHSATAAAAARGVWCPRGLPLTRPAPPPSAGHGRPGSDACSCREQNHGLRGTLFRPLAGAAAGADRLRPREGRGGARSVRGGEAASTEGPACSAGLTIGRWPSRTRACLRS